MVTADGRFLRCNDSENSDLFWALKGGGGNFGVVTEIEFKLSPLAPIVYGGLVAFPFDKTADIVRVWREQSHLNDDIGWAVA